MGFDTLDHGVLNIEKVLKDIVPHGRSNFREAYARGVGMMMQLNKEYF